jgi:hypothetical protein
MMCVQLLVGGEEVPGGLIIVRSTEGPKSAVTSSQPPPTAARRSPAPIPPPASQPLPSTSTSKRPPSRTEQTPARPPPAKRRRSSVQPSAPPNGSSSLADRSAPVVREPHVDEDIARMDDEVRSLRRASRSSSTGALNPEFVLPVPGTSPAPTSWEKTPARKGKSRTPGRETSVQAEMAEQERRGRATTPTAGPSNPGHRRKSSLSARGKRARSSLENSGIISEHHPRFPLAHVSYSCSSSCRLTRLRAFQRIRILPCPPPRSTSISMATSRMRLG